MIKGLHHNAYRCRDSEETRRFYEGFLGLPLTSTLEIGEKKVEIIPPDPLGELGSGWEKVSSGNVEKVTPLTISKK